MDYYSITTSDVEWRAAVCLCGSVACRGSFLHYATQDDLQQVSKAEGVWAGGREGGKDGGRETNYGCSIRMLAICGVCVCVCVCVCV